MSFSYRLKSFAFLTGRKNAWRFSTGKGRPAREGYCRFLWGFFRLMPKTLSLERKTLSETYLDQRFNKRRLKKLVQACFLSYGGPKTLTLVENLKTKGFAYSTRAGLSLNIEDLTLSPFKPGLSRWVQTQYDRFRLRFQNGFLNFNEYLTLYLDLWNNFTSFIKDEVVVSLRQDDLLNPVYMMAFSGARGNISQVRQLVGSRGLMTDANNNVVLYGIGSNFRSGLTVTEYVVSCSGARKGVVDTALRTATAGYLTRRLVDSVQHVVIRRLDCGSGLGLLFRKRPEQTQGDFFRRVVGRVLKQTLLDPRQNALAFANDEVSTTLLHQCDGLKALRVRSPLTCAFNRHVCRRCYGWSCASLNLEPVGSCVGILAAQSIGEPGTQLTMRTFHTGGVFAGETSNELYTPLGGWVFFPPVPGQCVRNRTGRIGFMAKTIGHLYVVETRPETKASHPDMFKAVYRFCFPPFSFIALKHGQYITAGTVLGSFFEPQGTVRLRGMKSLLLSPVSGSVKLYTAQQSYVPPRDGFSKARHVLTLRMARQFLPRKTIIREFALPRVNIDVDTFSRSIRRMWGRFKLDRHTSHFVGWYVTRPVFFRHYNHRFSFDTLGSWFYFLREHRYAWLMDQSVPRYGFVNKTMTWPLTRRQEQRNNFELPWMLQKRQVKNHLASPGWKQHAMNANAPFLKREKTSPFNMMQSPFSKKSNALYGADGNQSWFTLRYCHFNLDPGDYVSPYHKSGRLNLNRRRLDASKYHAALQQMRRNILPHLAILDGKSYHPRAYTNLGVAYIWVLSCVGVYFHHVWQNLAYNIKPHDCVALTFQNKWLMHGKPYVSTLEKIQAKTHGPSVLHACKMHVHSYIWHTPDQTEHSVGLEKVTSEFEKPYAFSRDQHMTWVPGRSTLTRYDSPSGLKVLPRPHLGMASLTFLCQFSSVSTLKSPPRKVSQTGLNAPAFSTRFDTYESQKHHFLNVWIAWTKTCLQNQKTLFHGTFLNPEKPWKSQPSTFHGRSKRIVFSRCRCPGFAFATAGDAVFRFEFQQERKKPFIWCLGGENTLANKFHFASYVLKALTLKQVLKRKARRPFLRVGIKLQTSKRLSLVALQNQLTQAWLPFKADLRRNANQLVLSPKVQMTLRQSPFQLLDVAFTLGFQDKLQASINSKPCGLLPFDKPKTSHATFFSTVAPRGWILKGTFIKLNRNLNRIHSDTRVLASHVTTVSVKRLSKPSLSFQKEASRFFQHLKDRVGLVLKLRLTLHLPVHGYVVNKTWRRQSVSCRKLHGRIWAGKLKLALQANSFRRTWLQWAEIPDLHGCNGKTTYAFFSHAYRRYEPNLFDGSYVGSESQVWSLICRRRQTQIKLGCKFNVQAALDFKARPSAGLPLNRFVLESQNDVYKLERYGAPTSAALQACGQASNARLKLSPRVEVYLQRQKRTVQRRRWKKASCQTSQKTFFLRFEPKLSYSVYARCRSYLLHNATVKSVGHTRRLGTGRHARVLAPGAHMGPMMAYLGYDPTQKLGQKNEKAQVYHVTTSVCLSKFQSSKHPMEKSKEILGKQSSGLDSRHSSIQSGQKDLILSLNPGDVYAFSASWWCQFTLGCLFSQGQTLQGQPMPMGGMLIFVHRQGMLLRRGRNFLCQRRAHLWKKHNGFVAQGAGLLMYKYKQVPKARLTSGVVRVEGLFEVRKQKLLGNTLGKALYRAYRNYSGFSNLRGFQAYIVLKMSLAAATYVLNQVQGVLAGQGVTVNDKHIEIILKTTGSRVGIKRCYDSGLTSGDALHRSLAWSQNAPKGLVYQPILMGISGASYRAQGFLSPASFQETSRMLARGAMYQTYDFLYGLKEKVISGHHMDIGYDYLRRTWFQGRNENGIGRDLYVWLASDWSPKAVLALEPNKPKRRNVLQKKAKTYFTTVVSQSVPFSFGWNKSTLFEPKKKFRRHHKTGLAVETPFR